MSSIPWLLVFAFGVALVWSESKRRNLEEDLRKEQLQSYASEKRRQAEFFEFERALKQIRNQASQIVSERTRQ